MYKIHISCLLTTITAEELKANLQVFGCIKQVKIRKGVHRLSSDSALLVCGDQSTYNKILSLGTVSVLGRNIFCEPILNGEQLKEKKRDLADRRVFISNIPISMEDDQIFELFSQFGTVQCAYRIRDIGKNKKRYGYVAFYETQAAWKAINQKRVYFTNNPIYISNYEKNKALAKKETQSNNFENQNYVDGTQAFYHNSLSTNNFNSQISKKNTMKNQNNIAYEFQNLPKHTESKSKIDELKCFLSKPNLSEYHRSRSMVFDGWHSANNLRLNTIKKSLHTEETRGRTHTNPGEGNKDGSRVAKDGN